jgi:hypothetical protein
MRLYPVDGYPVDMDVDVNIEVEVGQERLRIALNLTMSHWLNESRSGKSERMNQR